MFKEIGIIVNPKAKGVNKIKTLSAQFEHIIKDRGIVVTTETEAQLYKTVQEFKLRKLKIIGIAGGDGTIMRVLSTIREVYNNEPFPLIALLKGGTINIVAHNLGIEGDPVSILERVLRLYNRYITRGVEIPIRYQKTMLINNKYVCTLFGTGMGGAYFEEYYKGTKPGPIKAALVLGRFFVAGVLRTPYGRQMLGGVRSKIIVDGRKLPYTKYPIITASTLKSLPLGLKIYYRADSVPDTFHFIATHEDYTQIAIQLPRVLLGKPIMGEKHYDFVCKHVEIKFDEPFPWVIEGDVFYDPVITIKIGPLFKVVEIKAGDTIPSPERQEAIL